jgi:hypothetical protein
LRRRALSLAAYWIVIWAALVAPVDVAAQSREAFLRATDQTYFRVGGGD